MGKLTIKEAEDLQKSGVLSKKAVEGLQDKGLVSTRTRSNKRYIKTASGNFVSPQLYFQGIGKDKYSQEMNELKQKFNSLISEYTTTKNNK
jgi:predicted transcriptional regulator